MARGLWLPLSWLLAVLAVPPAAYAANPASVLTDHAEWCRRWLAGFEEGKNKHWHRTQTAMAT